MRAVHRWSLVAATCALAVVVPAGVRAWPVPDRNLSAAQVLALVRAGQDTAYSGTVETRGRLGLPVSDHFTDIADLLGGNTRLRVWWRSSQDWRVDKLLDTGEVDLFHHGAATIEWDYERAEARTSVDPSIRLPRDADLLPGPLAERALVGATSSDVSRLGPRRIAGVDTVGLRLDPADPRTSVDHVDLWADPSTGAVLALDAYGAGAQPALSTAFTGISLRTPRPAATAFHPAQGVRQSVDDILDIADAANQFAPFTPPDKVAGLAKTAYSRGAVGIYGTGLTQLMALPLQSRDAGYLADQLTTNGAALVDGTPLLRVGPLGVYLVITHQPVEVGVDLAEAPSFAWLVTGTVTDQTLVRAAADLTAGAQFR
jgi:hypothetical protein